jgi:hypothetical protein
VWASLRYIPGVGGRSCMRPRGWWIIHSRRWVYASFVVRGCSLELFWVCVIPRVCCVLGDPTTLTNRIHVFCAPEDGLVKPETCRALIAIKIVFLCILLVYI